MRIAERVDNFVAAHGKTVLCVLWDGPFTEFLNDLRQGRHFDQPLTNFLKEKQLPYVDLLKAHMADSLQFNFSADDYLKHYYVGHYNPPRKPLSGPCHQDKLVEMLGPKPVPYRS